LAPGGGKEDKVLDIVLEIYILAANYFCFGPLSKSN